MDDRMRRYNAGMNAPTVTNEHSLNELIKFEPEILALRIHRARFASGNSFQTYNGHRLKQNIREREIPIWIFYYATISIVPFFSFLFPLFHFFYHVQDVIELVRLALLDQ